MKPKDLLLYTLIAFSCLFVLIHILQVNKMKKQIDIMQSEIIVLGDNWKAQQSIDTSIYIILTQLKSQSK